MNFGMESETIEFKKSTSELNDGIISLTSMLNKHGEGILYFGIKNDGTICGRKSRIIYFKNCCKQHLNKM